MSSSLISIADRQAVLPASGAAAGAAARCGASLLLAPLLTLILGTAAPGHAAAVPSTATLGSVPMKGIGLRSLLQRFQDSGYSLIYSSDLVRSHYVVTDEPSIGPPLERLAQALEKFELALQRSDDNRHWLIVAARQPSAQQLTGRVTDATSGEPLAGVRITLDGLTTTTAADGTFEVTLSGSIPLNVSHDGYESRVVPSAGPADRSDLEIPLSATAAAIQEVVVVTSRYRLQREALGTRHSLSADELSAVPELGDDALRAVLHLPGTQSVGVSARPHIRGGVGDETLVLFDGIELLDPFHLKDFQSMFSSLNPAVIETIDVYTGGYPARYGDRMSGVMDVDVADEQLGFGAEVMLSLLTTSAAAYGSVGNERGRWAVAGRRGNLDLVTERLNPSLGKPSYSDWFGRFAWQLSPRTDIEANLLAYDDDILLQDIEEDEGEQAHSQYRNVYGWLRIHHAHSAAFAEAVNSTTTWSFGAIEHNRDGFIADEDFDDGVATVFDERAHRIASLAHSIEFDFAPAIAVETGGRLKYQRSRYDYRSDVARGDLSTLIGTPTFFERQISSRPEGFSGDAFVSARWRPNEWLTLEPGLRFDFQDYGSDGLATQWGPRLSAGVALGPDTHASFSAGRFHQSEGIHELQVRDGLTEFQSAQRSDHYIAALHHSFRAGFSVRLEAFHKAVSNPKIRFENLFNSFVLLPELVPDRIEIAPTRARANGMEATFRYRPNSATNLWLSYTNAAAEDEIDGRIEPRTWDQRHTVNAGLIISRDLWSLSAAVIWHSGWRTTPLPSPISDLDERVRLQRNSATLPSFFTLNARVSRTWVFAHQSISVFGEVTNLTNRENAIAVEYEFEPSDDGYQVIAEPESLLPRIPSVGFVWRFR